MNIYEMEFEGHITANFKFDIINIFKCHFRMHNCVVAGENYQESEFQTSTLPMICPTKFYF